MQTIDLTETHFLKCKCGHTLAFRTLIREPMHVIECELPSTPPNMTISEVRCELCGERYYVYGEIIKGSIV